VIVSSFFALENPEKDDGMSLVDGEDMRTESLEGGGKQNVLGVY
jgi:hypothetical protein